PFYYDIDQLSSPSGGEGGNGFYYVKSIASGYNDSYGTVVSGPSNSLDPAQIRHNFSIRGVGLRLPAIGVGWGYDTEGNPFPPGSGSTFIGDVEHGHQIDPVNYVAAPIDLRYDRTRKVWTIAGGT